jgi:hypothetical protein
MVAEVDGEASRRGRGGVQTWPWEWVGSMVWGFPRR